MTSLFSGSIASMIDNIAKPSAVYLKDKHLKEYTIKDAKSLEEVSIPGDHYQLLHLNIHLIQYSGKFSRALVFVDWRETAKFYTTDWRPLPYILR